MVITESLIMYNQVYLLKKQEVTKVFDKRELFNIYDGLSVAARQTRELMKKEDLDRKTINLLDETASRYERISKKALSLYEELNK